ncbi:MAG: hypothetical protein AMXMBFR57_26910 [Acidimicrobiia bacterium]
MEWTLVSPWLAEPTNVPFGRRNSIEVIEFAVVFDSGMVFYCGPGRIGQLTCNIEELIQPAQPF